MLHAMHLHNVEDTIHSVRTKAAFRSYDLYIFLFYLLRVANLFVVCAEKYAAILISEGYPTS